MCVYESVTLLGVYQDTLSGDSTGQLITPTREIKRPTCGALKKYLVGPTDLFSWLTSIVNLSIVLWSTTSH